MAFSLQLPSANFCLFRVPSAPLFIVRAFWGSVCGGEAIHSVALFSFSQRSSATTKAELMLPNAFFNFVINNTWLLTKFCPFSHWNDSPNQSSGLAKQCPAVIVHSFLLLSCSPVATSSCDLLMRETKGALWARTKTEKKGHDNCDGLNFFRLEETLFSRTSSSSCCSGWL